MAPIWLENAELGTVDEYAMHLVARNVGPWLDENTVKGHEDNLAIAKRCLAVLCGIAHFDLLDPVGLEPFAASIRNATVRVRHVIKAAN